MVAYLGNCGSDAKLGKQASCCISMHRSAAGWIGMPSTPCRVSILFGSEGLLVHAHLFTSKPTILCARLLAVVGSARTLA